MAAIYFTVAAAMGNEASAHGHATSNLRDMEATAHDTSLSWADRLDSMYEILHVQLGDCNARATHLTDRLCVANRHHQEASSSLAAARQAVAEARTGLAETTALSRDVQKRLEALNELERNPNPTEEDIRKAMLVPREALAAPTGASE